jgi:hypothetical protein
MNGQTAVEQFLKHGAIYGIGTVFLVCVLLLFLWVAMSTVSVLREWAPKWFQASIDSHRQVSKGVSRLSKLVIALFRRNGSTHEATIELVAAFDSYVSENQSKLGINSDVISHLKNAKRALRSGTYDPIFDGGSEIEEDQENGYGRRKRKPTDESAEQS